ncbi:hypothetical protein M408DRAFT_332617 [Serendipita vermifera MAFF 305830]|uniref:Fungal-type protein kinase domain-containing protein n=1 Tax=Serendipita vermifera MAFF 305830 TaxID=933852 RepID=A0A0C2W912_SERVB|nr:hypothetical protein M408DRAFT_332617 [Serendipita vermifera MAFF 305830]
MADEAGPSFASDVSLQPANIHYAQHKRKELEAAIAPALGEVSPEEFRALLKFSDGDECPQVNIVPIVAPYIRDITKKTCHDLFNAIADELKGGGVLSTEFHEQGDLAPDDRPAGTFCRPDIVAYDKSQLIVEQPSGPRTRSKTKQLTPVVPTEFLAWTHLEATAEFASKGKSKADGLTQALTYTAYHLLARPDRVVVLGFYISHDSFILIITGASGTRCTTELSWTNVNHIQLLRDFIYRILKPSPHMVDPTITRNRDGGFDIKLNGENYSGCRLELIGRPIGRRTTIFFTQDANAPIIKEQYLRDSFSEAAIINEIHENGPIPGVIQVYDHQEFQEGDSAVVCSIDTERKRHKVRLALKESGTPFMDIQTPYEVLVATYDLLETTRCVYTNVDILHRDISKGNVLYRSAVSGKDKESESGPATSDDASAEEKGGHLSEEKPEKLAFCGVRHLLDNSHSREATPVLLIDFDHSIHVAEERPFSSAGTPVFQARAAAVTAPVDPGTGVLLRGMPDLSEAARPLYMKVLSDRVKRFPSRPTLDIILRTTQEAADREWFHQLRHDAESAFWLLLWWAIHVRPDNNKPPTLISDYFWKALITPDVNGRQSVFTMMEGSRWLDPAYEPLETLIRNMALQLRGDLHWITDEHPKEMKEPEYVHEALQRLIFNFLVENQNQPFMTQGRYRSRNRQVEKDTSETSDLTGDEVNQRRHSSRASRSTPATASSFMKRPQSEDLDGLKPPNKRQHTEP